MYLNSETIEIQKSFADYCKSGVYSKIGGVSSNRVSHYRRLVFNNIKNTLEKAYPITEEWLGREEWLKLINEFFRKHEAKSPKIWELPKEFMEFVINENYARKLNKPALNDLLLIEWIEIEVHTMPDEPIPKVDKVNNYINDQLVLNPEYRLIKLDYPVHNYNADDAVNHKGDWFIYIYRDITSKEVLFLNISALHVFLIEKLYDSPTSLEILLPIISSAFGISDIQKIETHLIMFLQDLYLRKVLLGSTL